MKVILLEKINGLGKIGDNVDVKEGFARNFLLPEKKALRASKENIALFEAQKKDLEAKDVELKKEAQVAAKKVEKVSLVAVRQASEGGQLYGSVTSKDVAKMLKDENFDVNSNQVLIAHPIKSLGIYKDVQVILHPEVVVNITVNVARSQEEALFAEEQEAERLKSEDAAQKAKAKSEGKTEKSSQVAVESEDTMTDDEEIEEA